MGWLAVNSPVTPAACSLRVGETVRAAGVRWVQNASSQRGASSKVLLPTVESSVSLPARQPARLRSPGRHLALTQPRIVAS